MGNRLRGTAERKLLENSPNYAGFYLVYPPFAPNGFARGIHFLDNIVAVGIAAAGKTLSDPTLKASPCLVGEVFEEERIHGALEADMEFVNLTFGQGDDADIGKRELLEKTGDVFLVPGKPVQGFCDQDVVGAVAGFFQHFLITGPERARAADRVIGVNLGQRPAFLFDPSATLPNLIID